MIDREEDLPTFDRNGPGIEAESSRELPDDGIEPLSEAWTGDDIEQAYQKALAALDDVPWVAEETEPRADSPSDTPRDSPSGFPTETLTEGPVAARVASADPSMDGAPSENNAAPTPFEGASAPYSGGSATTEPAEPTRRHGSGPRLAAGTDRQPKPLPEELAQVSPAQIIEAALFVGGGALTAKKLCAALRGSFEVDFVKTTIDELNHQYALEARPYEIVSGEGGYQLELRAEHEKVRQRVYGSGPREVKLSQETLEILALVAYQQPISQQEVESHGKQNAGNLLRQLLRRDLVAIQRGEGGRKDVRYRTTPRFLEVFGLGSIDELPQPDDLARK